MRLEFCPLQKENKNTKAPLDFIAKLDAPETHVSGDAKSEAEEACTDAMRNCVIEPQASEPHNQHQIPSKAE